MQIAKSFIIFDGFDLLFHTFSSKYGVFFSYIKRMICVFLVFAIFFNISVTKNCKFEDKFLIALNCAVNTIESTVFNEYTNALMRTITGAVQDLSVIIQKTLADENNSNNNNPIPTSTNNSNSDVILTKRINDSYKIISFVKTNLLYLTYNVIEQGNVLYKYVIVNCKKAMDNIGILLFILFSIFIVRRKDEISKNILKVKVENRLAY